MKQISKKFAVVLFTFLLAMTAIVWTGTKVFAAEGTVTQKGGRYTVLVLDTSGSMRGTPVTAQKESAKELVKILLDASNADDKVAIIGLNTTTKTYVEFTDDAGKLNDAIDDTIANGGTNIYDALKTANTMLDEATASDPLADRNIILCSDGIPERGEWIAQGKYTASDHPSYYNYGNGAYEMAADVKNNGVTIYTIGFFHSLTGKDLSFGKQLMWDIASPEKNADPANDNPEKLSYVNTDAEKLAEAFKKVAETIAKEEPVVVDETPQIILSTEDVALREGETIVVTATLLPDSFAKTHEVEFWVDKDKYATVQGTGNDATITAILEGETYMMATIVGEGDELIAKCHVSVYDAGLPANADTTGIIGYNDSEDYDDDVDDKGGEDKDDVEVTVLNFEEKSLSLTVGNSKELPLTVEPEDVDFSDLVFTSQDEEIAEIQDIESGSARVVGVSAGKTTITVANKGGDLSDKITITVAPKSTNITQLNAGQKKFGVKWKMAKVENADGYQIEYSTSSKFTGSVKKTIQKRKTVSATIRSKVKSGRTYYVRIRTFKKYNGNKTIYSSWSKVREVKVQ